MDVDIWGFGPFKPSRDLQNGCFGQKNLLVSKKEVTFLLLKGIIRAKKSLLVFEEKQKVVWGDQNGHCEACRSHGWTCDLCELQKGLWRQLEHRLYQVYYMWVCGTRFVSDLWMQNHMEVPLVFSIAATQSSFLCYGKRLRSIAEE